MSLKLFHIVFIILAIATALGFGVWALDRYRTLAIASLIFSSALAVYFFWFIKKLRAVKS